MAFTDAHRDRSGANILFKDGIPTQISAKFEVWSSGAILFASGLTKNDKIKVERQQGAGCENVWGEVCGWHMCCKSNLIEINIPGFYRLVYAQKDTTVPPNIDFLITQNPKE
jgi:hypothetical protein